MTRLYVVFLIAATICATPLQAQNPGATRGCSAEASARGTAVRTILAHSNAGPRPIDVVEQQRVDDWIAPDKFRHFFASYGATATGYGITRLLGADHDVSLAFAVSGAAVAGIGKEIADVRRGSFFSFRDLLWDAAGIAAGVALANAIKH